MNNFLTLLLLPLYSAVVIAVPRGGIFVPDYFEMRCSPDQGFVTESFDGWAANLTEGTPLYFPLMSSLDVLRLTQDLFRESDLSFLTPEEVLNSCVTVKVSGATLTFNGYCGQTFVKTLIPVAPKVFTWKRFFPGGVSGTFRISLSDSKTWQVVDVCWGDGQRSFAVISLHPFLSACTRRVIVEHLKAIGFNEKFFTGLSYDTETCSSRCFRRHRPEVPIPFVSLTRTI